METTLYRKCDACGGFHKVDDMEVVTIQISKGKDCDISSFFDKHGNGSTKPSEKVYFPEETKKVVAEEKKNSFEIPKSDDPSKRIEIFDTPPMPALKDRPKSIIPKSLGMGMFVPPDSPNFERVGAKEVRRV